MRRIKISPIFLMLGFLIVFSFFRDFIFTSFEKTVDTTKAIEMIQSGEIKNITMAGDKVKITDKNDNRFNFVLPESLAEGFYDRYILPEVQSKNIVFNAKSVQESSFFQSIIPYIIMIGGFFLIFNLFFRQVGSQNKEADQFAKSKAKRFKPNEAKKVTFKDVAGLKEEKRELYEIVDFLKNPSKFTKVGARIPKGVLLVGPPGTGKTYISRAVAGEAGVPFFSISGSEFLEMFVGVGASRVRDLFREAKMNAPCIIFIDEIDAVGRKRGTGLGGGHDEREQTLNQLLVEMDGFEKNESIIIMAATNRPDILDDALLRPGRFDRTVTIGLPDLKGREEILKVHTADKPMGDDIDLKNIARRTAGFSPADLENLINEAALLSARINRTTINKDMLEEASVKVLAGPEKASQVITEDEKKLVSYHEAGHAIIGHTLKKTDPVHMVTIVLRGSAGGFTYTVPEEESNYYTKKQMIDMMIMLLGGRAAEDLKLGDISTGASNDIERVTKIAHGMVAKYGMSSKIGTLNYSDDQSQSFIGNTIGHTKAYSEEILKDIDVEMRDIVNYCYDKAKQILVEHDDALERLAKALIEKETVYKNEFEAIYNGDYDPKDFENEKLELY